MARPSGSPDLRSMTSYDRPRFQNRRREAEAWSPRHLAKRSRNGLNSCCSRPAGSRSSGRLYGLGLGSSAAADVPHGSAAVTIIVDYNTMTKVPRAQVFGSHRS